MGKTSERLLKVVKDPKAAFYSIARNYIRWYEGFSYNFEKNGERHVLDLLSDEPIQTVFDVGANVGSWTKIALARFPGANLHCFELSEDTFATLSGAITDDRAQLNNLGLSNAAGEITYKDYGQNSGLNTIIEEVDFHDGRVPYEEKTGRLSTGDQYCAEHGIDQIDILKIDVEGAEHLVLEGFDNLLSRQRIRVIQFEYGYAHGDARFLMKDFFALFRRHGYVVGPLKPTGVLFGEFHYGWNDFKSGPNYMAVVETETGLIEKLRGRSIPGFG